MASRDWKGLTLFKFMCYLLKIWFEVPRAMGIKITVLWDATPCSLLYIYTNLNFGGTFAFVPWRKRQQILSKHYYLPMAPSGTNTVEDCNVGESECKRKTSTYTVTCIKERKMLGTDYLHSLRLARCFWVSRLNKGGGGSCQNCNTAFTFPNFLE
jgi:hypothetical protein